MSYNPIQCWHIIAAVYDLDILSEASSTIKIIKKSILKRGYRAFFINERMEVEDSDWYRSYLLGEKILFYIEGSGVYYLANVDLTDNELYFEKSNLPTGFKPWIFYSWQSDYNPSRSHINSAIISTIKDINTNRSPKASLELVESTRIEDGADDIMSAIKRNIDRCLLAVFDITNVSLVQSDNKSSNLDSSSKAYPNSNVVFEMSYALQRKRIDQIILVKRDRSDITNEVPFDFNRNRYLSYKTESQARDKIKRQIIENLEKLRFISEIV